MQIVKGIINAKNTADEFYGDEIRSNSEENGKSYEEERAGYLHSLTNNPRGKWCVTGEPYGVAEYYLNGGQ